MKKILIFGGTVEARTLCEKLSGAGLPAALSMATAYGADEIGALPHIRVHSRRMDAGGMEEFIARGAFETVVDATHPYAEEATVNIREACARAGVECIRLVRGERDYPGVKTVPDIRAAVDFLARTEGRVLLTTGSRELALFRALPGYRERLYARVLPMPEIIRRCLELGFSGRHLAAMQGPFSREMNAAMLRQFGCVYLVSKNTGEEGGTEEKISAARETGAEVLLVERPVREHGPALRELLRSWGLDAGEKEGE